MIRRYLPHEEEDVRAHRIVQDWAASGWITEAQRIQLSKETEPALQRVSGWLRFTLFVFSLGCIAAFMGLLGVLHIIDWSEPTYLIFGVLSWGLGEYLIQRSAKKPYRMGFEEAAIFAGIVLLCFGLTDLFKLTATSGPSYYRYKAALRCAIALCLFGVAFIRYGYFYAALVALFAYLGVAGSLYSEVFHLRVVWMIQLGFLLVMVHFWRSQHRDDFREEILSVARAIVVIFLYLILNLKIPSISMPSVWNTQGSFFDLAQFPKAFYWATYIVIWILPALTMAWATRERDRALFIMGMIMAILTFATNKPYLGWVRHEWDPMILGVVLVGIAMALRKWLSMGPGGIRNGFTADRLGVSDKRLMAGLGALSYGVNPATGHAPALSPDKPGFQGGHSGGGGAQGGY